VVNYNVPLSLFKDTFDKDIYYGVVSYLKIYWDVLSRVCYQSQSNANPSAGTPEAYTVNPNDLPRILNLQLMLAKESNDAVINMVKSQMQAGLEYIIPFAQNFKVPNSNTTQSITQQLDMGLGHSLAKVYHQVYNNTEALDTAYDCANNGNLVNNPNADNSANQKTKTFYSQINGSRETDLTIECTNISATPFLDYMLMKRRLKGSCLMPTNTIGCIYEIIVIGVRKVISKAVMNCFPVSHWVLPQLHGLSTVKQWQMLHSSTINGTFYSVK